MARSGRRILRPTVGRRCSCGQLIMRSAAISYLMLQSSSSFVIPTHTKGTVYDMAQQNSLDGGSSLCLNTHHRAGVGGFTTTSKRRRRPASALEAISLRESGRSTRRPTIVTSTASPQSSQTSAGAAVQKYPAQIDENRLPDVEEPPARSVADSKRELLALTAKASAGMEPSSHDEERVAYLLEALESSYTPIQTVGFFNFAVEGKWHLAYTNAPMPPIGPRLTVREQFQEINPKDGKEGSVKNVLKWTLLDEDLDGRLEVACAYELDPKGRMNASLGGHRLLPDGKMPRDPQALVVLLQRAMPYELFDPSEHAFETTFMDESMRIVRISGPKLGGRLNIFQRDVPSTLPAEPQEKVRETTSGIRGEESPKPSAL